MDQFISDPYATYSFCGVGKKIHWNFIDSEFMKSKSFEKIEKKILLNNAWNLLEWSHVLETMTMRWAENYNKSNIAIFTVD